MKKLHSALVVAGVLLSVVFASCGKNADMPAGFNEEIALTADSIEIGVVIKAGNIFRADPYIIYSCQ